MTDNLEQLYPMSPLQQGILFHSLLEQAKTAYVEQFCYEIQGTLDVALLRRAWEQVTQIHGSLRTVPIWERAGEPLQAVLRLVDLPWQEVDYSSLPADERNSRIDLLLREDRLRGFDLSTAPLFRILLVHSGAGTHHLIWTYHHLILDGWSVGIVLREIAARYHSLTENRELQLSSARPYRDYIVWLKRQSLDRAREFWNEKLHGFTPTLSLSSGAKTTSEPSGLPVRLETSTLDPRVTQKIDAFSRRHGLTPNGVWLGAFALLLSRHTSSADFAIGVTTSGRPAELDGSDQMVGMFINTIPLRCRPDAGIATLDWLRHLQIELGQALQYDICSLPDISRAANVPGDGPLFETLFVFENYPTAALTGSGDTDSLNVRQVYAFEHTNYPLMVAINPDSSTLVQFTYDPHRFDAPTIRRMLQNFVTLVQQMIQRPYTRLHEYVLGEYPWPRNRAGLAEAQSTLHYEFTRQVQRTPDAVALLHADGELSYSELYRRAVRLAWELGWAGVGLDDRVAICIGRSEAVVIAILAALFAGGAYVPIDPAWPKDRIEFVLKDSDAKVILAERNILPDIGNERHILWVDNFPSAHTDDADGPPRVSVFPGNVACIIYTSGSTGVPKGAAIQHGSITSFLAAMYRVLSSQELCCVAATTSLTFDISIFELFAPLGCGGCIALFNDILSLPQAQHAGRVSLVNSVPSAVAEVLRVNRLPESIKTVCLAGEALPRSLADALHEAIHDLRLINLYGPTEDTIFSIVADIPPNSLNEPPIGIPLLYREAWILDWALQPVPTGTEGELYLAGAGLARGYWRRPGMTAQRFIPHPHALIPGERLYHTGDRARLRPDGMIEYLGRFDDQVKLRGFRIELGEIDFVLSSHPDIMRAVTIVQETASGKRLSSFVVPAPGKLPSPIQLKSHLAVRVPHYMVPSSIFVFENGLPTTSRGKLDRNALANWKSQGGTERASSNGPIQDIVKSIWTEVLDLEGVDSNLSFFEQGGHSLLASQAIARLRSALQVDLPLRVIFEHPTINSISRYIQTRIWSSTRLEIEPPIGKPHDGLAPCSYAQHRLWFLDRLNPGQATYNISNAIRLSGKLDVNALERSFDEIISRHEILRTSITATPTPQQVIRPSVPFQLPVEDAGADEFHLDGHLLSEAMRPFALDTDSLIRVRLFRDRDNEHVLSLTLHHIVCDGWSLAILGRELSALYTAFAAGQPSPLEPLAVQYADFARWQRDLLAGEVLQQHLTYWRERLRPPFPVTRLPGRRYPATDTKKGGRHIFEFTGELPNGLRQLARRKNLTLFSVLAAALHVLLYGYTGQTDVMIAVDISNRDRIDFERLIGLFVNQMLLRVNLRANPSFLQIAKDFQEQLLEGYAYQHLPFDRIIQEIRPIRQADQSPIYPVKLVMQNGPRIGFDLPGLSVSPIEVRAMPAARLDWTLAVEDGPGVLRFVSEYDASLYDQETIEGMLKDYEAVLSCIVVNPQQRLLELRRPQKASSTPAFDPSLSQMEVSRILDVLNTDSF